MENLRIIGSSHIAKQSVNAVKKEIEEFSPDIIALELDNRRAQSLFEKKEKISHIDIIKTVGFKGYVFSMIAKYAQEKLGKYVGVMPGAEMKTAIIIARQKNIRIIFIDQDIKITLQRFSNAITWKEKWTFVKEIFNALIFRKPKLNFDIRTVPDDELIKLLLLEVKKSYPSIYKVLIEERNKVMARRLYNLLNNYKDKKILAVVGAGHKEEMLNLIAKYSKEN